MVVPRDAHAISSHPAYGLIISGGHNGHTVLSSVESTLDGVQFNNDLPNMPAANHAHCQVQYKQTHSLLTCQWQEGLLKT